MWLRPRKGSRRWRIWTGRSVLEDFAVGNYYVQFPGALCLALPMGVESYWFKINSTSMDMLSEMCAEWRKPFCTHSFSVWALLICDVRSNSCCHVWGSSFYRPSLCWGLPHHPPWIRQVKVVVWRTRLKKWAQKHSALVNSHRLPVSLEKESKDVESGTVLEWIPQIVGGSCENGLCGQYHLQCRAVVLDIQDGIQW